MTTLITGATGFLGSAIARELLRDGRKIKLLARGNADLRNIEGLEAEVVKGDLRDRESLKSAMTGCSRLYHVAAYYSLWDQDKKLIYDINVQGTRNILETALELGLERVVYTSTVGCIGLSEDRTPTNEDQPMDPATLSNDYIKPTPTGKIVLDFLKGRMPAYLDTGLNLIDVADCARGHILADEKGRPGERYILGNKNMSLKEILQALEKITGIKAPSIRMPYWVAYAAGLACEAMSNLVTQKPPAVPLAGVKMAKYFMYFDSSKAIRELGLPQNPVEDALSQSVHWFQEKHR